ncbi:MAG: DUF4351 domain-containing protein [Candidatus Sericytochromatia bacterium]
MEVKKANKNKANEKNKVKNIEMLPPVFPILLYNGDISWTAKININDLIENNYLLGEYRINFKYFKIIERDYEKETLLKMKNLVSNLFLFDTKLEKLDDILLSEELSSLFTSEEDKKAISMLINYFMYILKDDKINEWKYDLLEKVYNGTKEVKSMFSTAVKNMREDLKNQGKIEGKIEGEVIGTQRTLKTKLLKLLTKKLGNVPKEVEEKILNCNEIEKLDNLIDNIFDISSFEQVLSEL